MEEYELTMNNCLNLLFVNFTASFSSSFNFLIFKEFFCKFIFFSLSKWEETNWFSFDFGCWNLLDSGLFMKSYFNHIYYQACLSQVHLISSNYSIN